MFQHSWAQSVKKKHKLKILIALYFLIIYWAQCRYWSTCQLWATLWSDSAQILQHVCADWQWNTEESGDSGGLNNWEISCNVSTIQSYCYDDHCLTTFAVKDKQKNYEELIRSIPGIEEHLVNSSEEEIIYIHCRPGKSFWGLFTCLQFSLLLSFARECLVPGEMTHEVLRVLFLTGSCLSDRLWVLHWLETRKMIGVSSTRPLVLCFTRLI